MPYTEQYGCKRHGGLKMHMALVSVLPRKGLDRGVCIVRKSLRITRAAVSAAVAAAAVMLVTSPAGATSASSQWRIPGGDLWEVNAWHCATYWDTCDWTASVKLLGNNPANAIWINNRTELEAHGVGVSIEISKEPKATLTMVSESLGQVTWTNNNAWIADNSGTMDPSGATVYVSTRSCGSGQVTPDIFVSEKCVYAGAF